MTRSISPRPALLAVAVFAAVTATATPVAGAATRPPAAVSPKPAQLKTPGAKPVTAPVQTAADAINQAWNYDKPAESEQRFRALLADARAKQPAFRLEVETQLARALGLQQQFEAAHKLLDGVEQALAGHPDWQRLRVRYLLERGRAFNSGKQREQAMPLFVAAWELARAAREDGLAVDAAHMAAIAEPDAQAQEAWNDQAIAYAEASADPAAQKWLGSLLNNQGWTFHDSGRPEQALALFEKCLAWHRARKTGEGEFIARWAVARCQRTLGRFEQALAAQQALSADRALARADEDGYVAEELAENLLALGREAEARPHFARAHALLLKDIWLASNEPKRLARLAELARE